MELITLSIWLKLVYTGWVERDTKEEVHVELIVREENLDSAFVH